MKKIAMHPIAKPIICFFPFFSLNTIAHTIPLKMRLPILYIGNNMIAGIFPAILKLSKFNKLINTPLMTALVASLPVILSPFPVFGSTDMITNKIVPVIKKDQLSKRENSPAYSER